MKKAVKPNFCKKNVIWKTPSLKQQITNQVLLKIKSYWDISGVTYETLEEELRQQCPSLMNIVTETTEPNKWKRRFNSLTIGNFFIGFILGAIDVAAYTSALEDYMLKGFYIVVSTFSIIFYFEFCRHKQKANRVLSWLKDLQNIEVAEGLTATQEKGFKTALKVSVFATRIIKVSFVIVYIILFLLTPLIRAIITGRVANLLPIPFKVLFVSHETVNGFSFHFVEMHLVIYATISCLCFGSSLLFSFIIHSIYYLGIVESFVKSKKKMEVSIHQVGCASQKQFWVKDLIEATSELSEYVATVLLRISHLINFRFIFRILKIVAEIFSNSMYFFERVCYMEMIVLWLAIKVAPNLLILAIGQLILVVFLYLYATINSIWSEKVSKSVEV